MMPGAMAGAMADMHQQALETVAGALSMTSDDLQQQLQSGQTVAQIATARGVDPDALADQLTNAMIQQHRTQLHDMIRRAMDHSFAGRANQDR